MLFTLQYCPGGAVPPQVSLDAVHAVLPLTTHISIYCMFCHPWGSLAFHVLTGHKKLAALLDGTSVKQVANAQAAEQHAEPMGAGLGAGGGAGPGAGHGPGPGAPPPPGGSGGGGGAPVAGDGIDQDLQARLDNLRKS